MSLAFAVWLLGWGASPGIRHCEMIDWRDANSTDLICVDNGEVYDSEHYALHHDRDDGEIVEVEVWR